MGDIKSPKLIWIKGGLFLLIGLFASVLLILRVPNLTVILLHILSIWAFCRFYYFTFYVIQYYVDPTYRFAGLFAFLQYALFSRSHDRNPSS